MKMIALAVLFAATAWGAFSASAEMRNPLGYTPVPGSCTSSGLGSAWCDCDLRNSLDDSITHATLECRLLYCYDMKDQNDPSCVDGTATCQLTNVSYGGIQCTQQMPYDGVKVPTPDAACKQVQQCLNSWNCASVFCGGTTLHGGWRLDSASGN